MPSNKTLLRNFVAENTKIPCSAEGCPRLRDWRSKLCKYHSYRNNRFGSPHGRVILPKIDYHREMAIANQLFSMNVTNEAILTATAWIEDMIRSSHAGSLMFRSDHVNKLLSGDIFYKLEVGSFPIQFGLLPQLVALYLVEMAHYYPVSVPHMNLPWRTLMVGHSFFRNGSYTYKRKHDITQNHLWKAYRAMGPILEDNLGVLLARLAGACIQLQKKMDTRDEKYLDSEITTDPDEVKVPAGPQVQPKIIIQ